MYNPIRKRVLCADGIVRTSVQTADADTFWTLPSYVRVQWKTVSGFIWYSDLDEQWRFTANSYGKNARLIKEIQWRINA